MLPFLLVGDGVAEATTTALNGVVTELQSAVTSVAPIAIPVIGAGLVVTIAIKVFKRVANKAQDANAQFSIYLNIYIYFFGKVEGGNLPFLLYP